MNSEYFTRQLTALMGIDSPSGFTSNVADYTLNEFKSMGFEAWLTKKGCVVADLGGEGSPLVIAAHIDTLGGMVVEIKSNGRLKISNIGGLNASNCETENCRIYCRFGEKTYTGTLQLENASIHVNSEFSKKERKFENMEIVVDENVKTKEDTEKLGISVGDFVCFDPRTVITDSGYIKSRFLDDKLSVAMLLSLAKRISAGEVKPSRKIYAFITVYEEVGHGACGAVPDADEMLCVDMGCVGTGLTCDEHAVSICVKDSGGPYDYGVTTALIQCARDNGIHYAADAYPHYGSDAGAALYAGYDIKHGLIGAGVYASHGYERSHMDGVCNTLKLLEAYIQL